MGSGDDQWGEWRGGALPAQTLKSVAKIMHQPMKQLMDSARCMRAVKIINRKPRMNFGSTLISSARKTCARASPKDWPSSRACLLSAAPGQRTRGPEEGQRTRGPDEGQTQANLVIPSTNAHPMGVGCAENAEPNHGHGHRCCNPLSQVLNRGSRISHTVK